MQARLMPAPSPSPCHDYENGVLRNWKNERRRDVLMRGWAERRFPATTLRLPMVNSEHDHYESHLRGYYLRLAMAAPY